jgi:hypothetical protein
MEIYLDQKDWIGLARILHGKDTDPASLDLLKRLDAAVSEGSVRVSLSRVHLLEAIKIGEHERRKRLVQAFVHFSRGCVVRPAELVVAEELAQWGRGESAHAGSAVGRGLLAAMGDYGKHAQTLGVSAAEVEYEDLIGDNPLAWSFALSRPEFGAWALQIHAIADRYVATVDRGRSRWARLPQDRRMRVYAQGVLADIQAALSPVPADTQSAIDRLLALAVPEFLAAIAQIPTVEVMVRVGEAAARDTNQPTKPNDLWDLSFLSVAIPYFDVVVTERTWAHHATALGLSSRYSCQVLPRLTDLTSHLPGGAA